MLEFFLQVSVGDEGYMVLPPAPGESEARYYSPTDDGTYGVDFARNLQDRNIAFGTVHFCAGPALMTVSVTCKDGGHV